MCRIKEKQVSDDLYMACETPLKQKLIASTKISANIKFIPKNKDKLSPSISNVDSQIAQCSPKSLNLKCPIQMLTNSEL